MKCIICQHILQILIIVNSSLQCTGSTELTAKTGGQLAKFVIFKIQPHSPKC